MASIKTHSAGGVVLNERGEILIVSQRGRSWSLPKGHLENGEDPLTAARREIYEESGLRDLQLIRPLGSYERMKIGLHGGEDASECKQLTFFLFKATSQTLQPVDPDNPEARWLDRNQVAGYLTHPRDKEFFQKILPTL